MPSEFRVLLREPVTLTVAGATFTLPYQPAAVWVGALDRIHILGALLASDADRDALATLILDDPRALDDLKAESLRILGEATGRKWWESGRLLATSTSTEVLGRLVLAGADPWTRSVGEWAAAVYALCMENKDQKDRDKFDFTLGLPPPGYDDEWDDGLPDLGDLAAQYAQALGG